MLPPQHQQIITSALCTFKLIFTAWCWLRLKEILEHNLWGHLLVLSLFGQIKTTWEDMQIYKKKHFFFGFKQSREQVWIFTGDTLSHGHAKYPKYFPECLKIKEHNDK